jgi:hypothetical protein
MEPGPSAARAKERKRGIELSITFFFVYHGLMKESNAGLSTSFLSSVGVHLHATQGRGKR